MLIELWVSLVVEENNDASTFHNINEDNQYNNAHVGYVCAYAYMCVCVCTTAVWYGHQSSDASVSSAWMHVSLIGMSALIKWRRG